LSDVNALAEVCEPGVKVIVIGERNDIGLFRDLMGLGVTDYLVKPMNQDLLQRSMTAAIEGQSSNRGKARTGKVVTFYGARGGVGTTTLLANLGFILSEKIGRRVVLLDLDLTCGDLGLMMGVDSVRGMSEALRTPGRIDARFLERSLSACGQRLFALATEEPYNEKIEIATAAMDELVENLEQQFHYILVDLPRRLDDAGVQLLSAAETRFIVVEPSLASVRDTIRLLDMIGKDRIGQRTLVVMNHREGNSKGAITEAMFEESVGRKVDFVLPFSKTAMSALNAGVAISSKPGPLTDALNVIADDLSGRAANSSSTWRKLFKKG
jgi:pilus assembly protein CpaE